MSDLTSMTPIISRGLALHKMIRFVQWHFNSMKSNHPLAVLSRILSEEKDTSISKAMNLGTLRSFVCFVQNPTLHLTQTRSGLISLAKATEIPSTMPVGNGTLSMTKFFATDTSTTLIVR